MKIIYFFEETSSYMHQWQRVHIFDELERNGHQIEVFNPITYSSTEEANEKLCDYLKTKSFDLFMTCVSSEIIFEETIQEVKKIGLPTLLICFDNLHAPFMHKAIAPFFDIVWLTSQETIGMFKKWGCKNIVFQTYAANPYNFNPYWGEIDNSINFIGSPYGGRVNKINKLTQSNLLCKVYSNSLVESNNDKVEVVNKDYLKLLNKTLEMLTFNIGRKVLYGAVKNKFFNADNSILEHNNNLECLPSVSFLDMQKTYSSSSLSLNITELRNTYVLDTPIHKMHLRTFEIPMSGGLEIASYTEELASYFKEDKEIVLYKSNEELISKAKFYLDPKNDSLTSNMKRCARERAAAEHTWMNRFDKIFGKL
ncbi:glycosyltransferase family protein [Polaribacter sp. L3A8]|uniref:glycosyltransferase family protein n=1 Tax=Polaribacter sp. L3A8 TaxID=2686361 RepID=UPI00131A90C6|nr:glycosyltransferase [Polaribacter sp. L3A8]